MAQSKEALQAEGEKTIYSLLSDMDKYFADLGCEFSSHKFNRSGVTEEKTDHGGSTSSFPFPKFSDFVFTKTSMTELILEQGNFDENNGADNCDNDGNEDDDFDFDDIGSNKAHSFDYDDDASISYSDDTVSESSTQSISESNIKCGRSSVQKHISDANLKAKCTNALTVYQAGKLSCKCAHNCLQTISIGQARHTQEAFWGKDDDTYPTSSTRTIKIHTLLQNAYDGVTRSFKFKVFDPVSYTFAHVCESAIVTLLFGAVAKSFTCSLKTAPRGWRACKNRILATNGGQEELRHLATSYENMSQVFSRQKVENKQRKRNGCIKYMKDYSANNCEASVLEAGVKYLPFRSIRSFYTDYVLSMVLLHGDRHRSYVASLRTFERAFKDLQKQNVKEKILFSRSKGNFNVCEVCNAAADLLTTRRFSSTIRDLIGQYRKYVLLF
jgi:hypothetical protein